MTPSADDQGGDSPGHRDRVRPDVRHRTITEPEIPLSRSVPDGLADQEAASSSGCGPRSGGSRRRSTAEEAAAGWQPSGYYTAYYATAGFLLGSFGAMASLLFNVIGAPIAGKSPLELIRIYLTFPLGGTGPGADRHGHRASTPSATG